MVHFNIHLKILIQTILTQESDNGLCIYIVLMLGWFHWFGLNEECTLETFSTSIVTGHTQHRCQMVFLPLHIGIKQAHISFAAAPEYIILTTQLDGGIDGILDLYDSTSHHIEIGIRSSTIHIALVPKDIGRAPQQTDARLLLLLLQIGHYLVEVLLIFLHTICFLAQIHIMEAIVLNTHLLHKLETSINLVLGSLYWVLTIIPWECLCTATKLVSAFGTQSMPPGHGKTQPIFHLPSHNHALRLVVVEGHRVLTLCSLEGNLLDVWKKFFHVI